MTYLIGERTFTARKSHLCEWCFGSIPAGERYMRSTGVFEGDFSCTKWHTECDVAAIASTDTGELFCQEGHRRGATCEEMGHT